MVAFRSIFIIDQEGIVRYQSANDFILEESIQEVLRVLDSLQYFEMNGEILKGKL